MARLVRLGSLRRVCFRLAAAAAFLMLRRAARRCLEEAIVSSLVSSRPPHALVHWVCQGSPCESSMRTLALSVMAFGLLESGHESRAQIRDAHAGPGCLIPEPPPVRDGRGGGVP